VTPGRKSSKIHSPKKNKYSASASSEGETNCVQLNLLRGDGNMSKGFNVKNVSFYNKLML